MKQQNNRPSAVIWDMGGILYRFFTEVLVEKGAIKGWPLDKLPLGPTGLIPDPHYLALDRGEIKEPEYVKRLVKEFSRQGIDYLPYEDVELAPPPLRAETWKLVEKIRNAGLRQMLLTNDATVWLGERWWETWPHIHLFDGVVDVKNVGVPKPSPEPYLACLEKLDVRPDDCIFIDDMHVNCSGAEAVGMSSYWFDISAPEAAAAELGARLEL